MSETSRLELFNQCFLLILDQLIENIPRKHPINPVIIADAMGVSVTESRRAIAGAFTGRGDEGHGFGPLPNGDQFYDLYVAVLDFMDDEAFLRRARRNVSGSGSPGKDAVITAKGIAAINIPLPGQGATVMKNIKEMAKSGSAEARSAIIGETVGAIFAAVARGFLSNS